MKPTIKDHNKKNTVPLHKATIIHCANTLMCEKTLIIKQSCDSMMK